MLWLTDEEMDEELERLFEELEVEKEPVKNVSMSCKEATEANKTRDICILCGKKTETRAVLASVIKYCPCVEKM